MYSSRFGQFLKLGFGCGVLANRGVSVAKGRPFEVTVIRLPCCTISRYFKRLALSSLMLTFFILSAPMQVCTSIMYKYTKKV